MGTKLPFLLILLGISLILIGASILYFSSDKKEFSGLILIGPIPIPLGNFPISVALFIGLVVLFFYLFFYFGK